jgi:hypothetical protein
MKPTWIAGMAALLIAGQAVAARHPFDTLPHLGLEPMVDGDEDIDTIYGKCGEAVVRISSLYGGTADHFDAAGGQTHMLISLPGGPGKAERDLSVEKYLLGWAGTTCVSTPRGKRLLIWTVCGGPTCNEVHLHFYVVTPSTLTIYPSSDQSKDECNAKCASRVLGNDLPKRIDYNFFYPADA